MFSCESEESVDYKGVDRDPSEHAIDVYFQENFQDKYGCAVRWQWVDKYVDIDYVVTPAKQDVVIPTGEMIMSFWIEPFMTLSKEGGDFIRDNFPPEIVFLGTDIRDTKGTIILGYAEGGVRITLTGLNKFDLHDDAWLIQQLETMHHEFTHIVNQKYPMPEDYKGVTPDNYTSTSWSDIYTKVDGDHDKADEVAIALGMVSPYGTSSFGEDFAEIVSKYLLMDEMVFAAKYLTPNEAKPELDEGKAWIATKLDITRKYYQSTFGIDIDKLRDIIQTRLNHR